MSADAEAALLTLAARQHSVFMGRQAIDLGVPRSTIGRRVKSGLWLPLHRNVFTTRSAVPDWRQKVMAGILAGGPRAFASHRSSGCVWGVLDDVKVPEITIPHATRRSPRGVIVH